MMQTLLLPGSLHVCVTYTYVSWPLADVKEAQGLTLRRRRESKLQDEKNKRNSKTHLHVGKQTNLTLNPTCHFGI